MCMYGEAHLHKVCFSGIDVVFISEVWAYTLKWLCSKKLNIQ